MNNLFTNRPWAATIEAISAAAKAAARAPGEQEPTSAPTAIRTPAGTIIVPINGLLVKAEREAAGLRAFGIDSTAYSEISDLLADTTGPVVLAINSLGGMLSGLEKCANAIYSARPRILAAAIEGAGASAAYVLAAAAGCKIYADADALVGAAGVVVQGTGGDETGDTRSAYKHAARPLAEQETADWYAAKLYRIIERGRGDTYKAAAGRLVPAGNQEFSKYLIDDIGEITLE